MNALQDSSEQELAAWTQLKDHVVAVQRPYALPITLDHDVVGYHRPDAAAAVVRKRLLPIVASLEADGIKLLFAGMPQPAVPLGEARHVVLEGIQWELKQLDLDDPTLTLHVPDEAFANFRALESRGVRFAGFMWAEEQWTATARLQTRFARRTQESGDPTRDALRESLHIAKRGVVLGIKYGWRMLQALGDLLAEAAEEHARQQQARAAWEAAHPAPRGADPILIGLVPVTPETVESPATFVWVRILAWFH